MACTTIRIATDFSRTPGGRYREDGDFSGEQFREEFLVPALDNPEGVIVFLDDTDGYPSSFLEEAFGGLVRAGFSNADLQRRLVIRNDDPLYDTYRVLAEKYIREARPVAVRA
jgi:hypothetical protein